jgi:hypothetical protein
MHSDWLKFKRSSSQKLFVGVNCDTFTIFLGLFLTSLIKSQIAITTELTLTQDSLAWNLFYIFKPDHTPIMLWLTSTKHVILVSI